MLRATSTLVASIVVAGTMSTTIDAAEKKIVVYSHGQKYEHKPEGCWWLNGPPSTLKSTAVAAGYKVFHFCKEAVERPGDRPGSYIYKRVDLLKAKVQQLIEKEGYRPENIVLAGHSAGAWTSLMLVSKDARLAKKVRVIAFAPSCCGTQAERAGSPPWRRARTEQIADLLSGASFRALTFSYDDDEYENTASLQFLTKLSRLVPSNCGRGHDTYRNDCKAEETAERIADFLK
jgi:hypothetical protein